MSIDPRGAVLPVTLVVIAEATGRANGYKSDALALPSQVFAAGWSALLDGSMLTVTAQTLYSAGIGLLIGFGIGLALGILLGLLPIVDRLLEVTVETIRPIPSVALIPIVLLVFGLGYRMEITIIAFATIWPTLIIVRAAVSEVDDRLLEVARLLEIGPVAKVMKIVLPAAIPGVFVALRLSIGVALVVAVTVEITANTIGIGNAMLDASRTFRPDLMLALLVWLGVLGWLLNIATLHAYALFFETAPEENSG